MIYEPASFQKRTDENYKDKWISRLHNSTNVTTLKVWVDNPCKECSQYFQENYQEVHGNYPQWIRQQWQKHWSRQTWGETCRRTIVR